VRGIISVLRVEHRPEAVSALVERIAGLEADPAEVRVVIETRHGLLVEALVEAGYTVLPVNPELVSRRRGPARKKDDAEDARICCLSAPCGASSLIAASSSAKRTCEPPWPNTRSTTTPPGRIRASASAYPTAPTILPASSRRTSVPARSAGNLS
jgi:hypothetical protein